MGRCIISCDDARYGSSDKMIIKQYRIQQTDTATMGVFALEGELFYTVELPWKNNKKNISCIPAGHYTCKRVWSETNETAGYKEAFEILNVPGDRTDIIFAHVGNSVKDIEGCSAAGLIISLKEETVSKSISAVNRLMKKMKGVNEFNLEIKD